MASKIGVRATVQLDTYGVISDAVERGLHYGWHRVTKYHDGAVLPDVEMVVEHMHNEVMNALCEVMLFGREESGGDVD